MRRDRHTVVVDRDGQPVTQERWNEVMAELARLRNQTRKRLMRLPEVLGRVGLQKTQVYELMAAGRFPQAIKITERCVGWLEHEIDAYIEARVAESRRSGMRLVAGAPVGASADTEHASR